MEQPIRVLHILHSMNRGGAENAIMNYYRNIERDKIQFDFLVTEQNHMQFEDEILGMGGRIFRVPLLTMKNPFPYLKSVYAFFKAHPEYKIVHSHTSSKSVFPLGIAKLCDIPVRCSHSHSSMAENGLSGLIRKALMPFLKITATDMLSCGNQAAIYLYGEKSFNDGNVKIFKNVIETEKFRFNAEKRKEIRTQLGIEDGTILLGHTARFDPVKNHPFDIEILSELKKSGQKTKLLLVGKGTEEEIYTIKQKAQNYNVYNDIIFTGVVPNVYDYEQAMDIFLLPSFNEGLPLSIIEAQVSGLPCFTTKYRVSIECSVTNLVTYLPLESGSKVWAESIKGAMNKERTDRWVEIANAGYDAKTSAPELQSFYSKRYEESI